MYIILIYIHYVQYILIHLYIIHHIYDGTVIKEYPISAMITIKVSQSAFTYLTIKTLTLASFWCTYC